MHVVSTDTRGRLVLYTSLGSAPFQWVLLAIALHGPALCGTAMYLFRLVTARRKLTRAHRLLGDSEPEGSEGMLDMDAPLLKGVQV